jgi:hypothetical protein
MRITPEVVRTERDWVRARAPAVVGTINATRETLGELFGTSVDPVGESAYRREVDAVFADGDRAVNVATYVCLLRELDVTDDYPGFVVDERLGRALAATIAGGDPLGLLAEATFHVADVQTHAAGGAGADDLQAALAAGFQTRLPGWNWRETTSPFAVAPGEESTPASGDGDGDGDGNGNENGNADGDGGRPAGTGDGAAGGT